MNTRCRCLPSPAAPRRPGLTRALGDRGAARDREVARPISIAALAQLSRRRPLVVACPTGRHGRPARTTTSGSSCPSVALFPAWETLPFERISPSVETMGRRLEVLWRLRDPDRFPAMIVAGVRALLQGWARSDDGRADRRPARTRSSIPTSSPKLVEFGYRREELVEHRGEFARRGAIIDVFPSTADAPIRIDLWGDEVDRLTTFGVNDQRSPTTSPRCRSSPPAS